MFLEIFGQCGNWNVKQIPFNINNIVISIYYISVAKRDCQGSVPKCADSITCASYLFCFAKHIVGLLKLVFVHVV